MRQSKRRGTFPIVAIGASAGGLKAFEDLLNALPRDPGMAFVLVPHLAPQFKSHLSEILARCTRLEVSEVKAKDKVMADRIYVVPPNRAMRIKDGVLHLSAQECDSTRRNPIDRFFISMADDQKERAIGVLLSGAGSDGTAGLQAIKERGGTTFAQDGDTAAHVSMPHSAVVSGCVDFVLSPAEIGRRLGGGRIRRDRAQGKPKTEDALNRILELLRTSKGVEFGLYKRSTLRRRIQRRMALKKVREPEKYLRLLKTDPAEVDQIFNDILISVTSFFREPESFRALKSMIYPRILKNRPISSPVRIWVPGCSTGEEAYSHAMNLVEFLGKRAASTPFQIFATDVNPAVVEKARAGRYSKKAAAGVSAERLRRFFVETEDGYRVAPFLRERCVFAVHNLVQDPPFTSLDLISCRNLMIYLGEALQEKTLQIFQYALKPRGLLMLGRSETVGDFSGRFTPLDEKKKVFSVRTTAVKARLDFTQPSRFLETESAFKDAERAGEYPGLPAPAAFDLQGQLDGVLPARYVPNGVIVNSELEVLRFLGNTSLILRQAPGKPSLNLRRMASGEFLLELRAAIQAAKVSGCAVRKEIAAPLPGDGSHRAQIEVAPIKAGERAKDYFLILFEDAAVAEPDRRAGARRHPGKESRRVVELKESLAVSGAHLKSIIDEQESTNARLKSSNESLLSSNEELQSINEEFETTKEELQSTNEELQSTNEELTTSTEEVVRGNQILSRSNNDLSNLLANINIPVVLLDIDLAIHRFTPPAGKVLGLTDEMVGRSIVDIHLPLLIPNLKKLLQDVIKNSAIQKLEVQDARGRWYYLLIRPYRTDKSKTERSRTEGAVLAMIDIHDRKLAEKAMRRLATVVLDSNDAIIVCDLRDRITAWNKGAQKMYGYAEKEALGMSVRLLMPGNRRIRARDLARVSAAPVEIQRRARTGRILDVQVTVTVLRDDKGRPVEVATTERDITVQKQAERDQKVAKKTVERLATVVLDSNDAIIIIDLNDRITAWNKGAQKMYGYTEAEALGMSILRLMPSNMRVRARELVRSPAEPFITQRQTKDGRILDVLRTVTILHDASGHPVEVAKTERDITEQMRAERELRWLHSRVISAQETERKRLARELHDGVGQILSGVKYRLQALPGKMTLSGGAEAKILKVGGFLDHAIAEIRRVSQNLMPAELVDLGLETALLTLCRNFKDRSGVYVTLRTVPVDASPDMELSLFRITQEALNNISKHSKATMATVTIVREGHEVVLSVSDNGIGFAPKMRPLVGRGIGLGNMRHRAESIGGSIELHSKPGSGTTLSVRVPLPGIKGDSA